MRVGQVSCADGEFTGVVVGDAVRLVGPARDDVLLGVALSGELPAGPEVGLADVVCLPPVRRPPSIRDFYAFERHVATARRSRGLEVDPGWYERPVFYFANPAAVLGDREVVRAPARSRELDYELELAAVVGAGGVVAGYTVLGDWSARDLQRAEMTSQLGPAKGKDFATSLGPWLVTPDELDPDAAMTAAVNGRRLSAGSAGEMWWSWAELVSYAAESTTLRPGDVLGSGTVGTGCLLELRATGVDEPWLAPGDVVELAVAGIGTLTTTVGSPRTDPWSPDPDRVRPPRA